MSAYNSWKMQATITTISKVAMAEGWKFKYPTTMMDDEIERLVVLVSELDRPVQPPLPRYTTGIMPPGLTEEEAL
jgi:hypothetical protein